MRACRKRQAFLCIICTALRQIVQKKDTLSASGLAAHMLQ